MEKTNALRFVNINFLKKPSLYVLKTLNLKLTLPSLGKNYSTATEWALKIIQKSY
jgi:hypothetical protein